MQRNRLAAETSPYLRQHAHNPVDWYPWGEEALTAARREGKPILLSVGYSACHWCHVMAHESFEDPATAALMNRHFINVKVDREERPDVDKIYQIAQQLITRRAGGWPLTMFLSPEDQRPFFGGTYFPKDAGRGMPAFRDILERVADYHANHGAQIREQNEQLMLALASLEPAGPDALLTLDAVPLTRARAELERVFDGRYGGFGHAPKFPHPPNLERCLRQWHATSQLTEPDLKSLYMASLTLTRMAEGGLYDQLAGGFARYAVDDAWMIPHFEKMLYDNAQLLTVYARAALATGEPLFKRIAVETADWLLLELRAPAGGFYSSLDADSAGHEGQYYVWHPDEVRALLTPETYALFARRFGLGHEPNFEGRWHLYVCEPIEDSERATLDAARRILLEARTRRERPARDEKLLTAWNALTIKGLAVAARVFERQDYVAAATAAVDFIGTTLWKEERLLATATDGHGRLPAYLDDHAFLLDALIELLQCRWRTEDLRFAQALAETLLLRFEDAEHGGFYFTASDHEALIHRGKSFADDALPSGNAVAVSALTKLGHLLGEPRYLDAAERALRAGHAAASEHPLAHMGLLNALDDLLSPLQILIIRGEAQIAARWSAQLGALYHPTRVIFPIPVDTTDLPPALASKSSHGETTAYLCVGSQCGPPITSLSELARRLATGIDHTSMA